MSTVNAENQPNKSPLAKYQAEIQKCEHFMALCERIKLLEKAESENAQGARRAKLENQRAQSMHGIDLVTQEIQQMEDALAGKGRKLALNEEDDLVMHIRLAKSRLASMRTLINEATASLARIDQEIANNADLLQKSYEQLEQYMEQDGLHPNSVAKRLADLREQKELLSEAIKANRPIRPDENNRSANDPNQFFISPKGLAISEKEFYKYFIEDLRSAQRSVEIVSPILCEARAMMIMPLLGQLAQRGLNVMIITKPVEVQIEQFKQETINMIAEAHKAMVTVIQRKDLENSAAIIDDSVCWEGDVLILGPIDASKTMRRANSAANAREMRHFVNGFRRS